MLPLRMALVKWSKDPIMKILQMPLGFALISLALYLLGLVSPATIKFTNSAGFLYTVGIIFGIGLLKVVLNELMIKRPCSGEQK